MSKESKNDGSDPSFQALVYQWGAQISTISLGMVLPALIGVWLDRLFGTVVLFVILGVILGMALGFWQLIKFANRNETSD